MIGVKLEGRIGNQLFQYAFALNLARKTRQQFYIDQKNFTFDGRRYFDLPSFNKFRNRINQELGHRINKMAINIEDQWLAPAGNLSQFKLQNAFFQGFFQSENYFQDKKELIRHEFRLKDVVRIDARKHLGIPGEKYIAMHLRRTDYVEFGDETLGGKNLVLPISYYLNALASIANLNQFKIVVVSDEIETVKRELNIENALYTSDSEMIIDFQVIQQADIAIIANSSFSWWAAYLGNDNKVIAPEYWLGFKIKNEIPKSIIPSYWTQISI
jgi:hypothetical protein